jgi:FtsH-binding integral membrane protein
MNSSGLAHIAHPLTKSQIISDSKTKNRLIAGAYALYILTLIPLLVCLISARQMPRFHLFILETPSILFYSLFATVIVGIVLGFSREACRKFPLNFILYFTFVTGLTFFGMATTRNMSFVNIYVLFAMLISVGVSFIIYSLVARKEFKGLFAIMISTGALLINVISFGFAHSDDRPHIFVYFAISMICSLLMAFGSQEIAQNKSYKVLKNDYLYIAFKLVSIIPLIPHITGDREDYGSEEEEY